MRCDDTKWQRGIEGLTREGREKIGIKCVLSAGSNQVDKGKGKKLK